MRDTPPRLLGTNRPRLYRFLEAEQGMTSVCATQSQLHEAKDRSIEGRQVSEHGETI